MPSCFTRDIRRSLALAACAVGVGSKRHGRWFYCDGIIWRFIAGNMNYRNLPSFNDERNRRSSCNGTVLRRH